MGGKAGTEGEEQGKKSETAFSRKRGSGWEGFEPRREKADKSFVDRLVEGGKGKGD